ncbi:SdpI family protein [Bifidobacterium merycicum]|uniref:Putative membrane protein n=1 Tax=Bifidobacterium merycicum TaxID=78345 RepID=A0A087BII9_9BIFI|nr:SdpI family protein [Bifidobacterium merycicum]KFI70839.1 putative membrane protein [Bifidobacterium merycicum]MEE1295199.1 SdpI family protein [Bifidobacterium merycicum]SHE33852.1 Uncharacterized membrane protein [Bifidobacterium merycicum DSM 6492]
MNSANNTNGNASGRGTAPISRRIWIILAVLCVANIIAHLALFGRLPEQVPTHWGADGSVNGYGPRAMTLILDILPLVLLGLFRIIPGMDPKGESYGKAGGLYRGFVIAFTLIMCGMTWLTEITVFGLIPTKGGPVGLIVSVALGALFIGLGNYLPRMRQNYTFGIRTPWALADENNWNRTQRFGGAVFMVMGALIAIAGIIGFLLPINDGVMVGLIVAIALLGTLAMCGYSYLLFARSRGGKQGGNARAADGGNAR